MTITPSYFNWLPTTDVIHEWIMPMLDYESRIQFNQSLKPIERMSWRFPAEDIMAHDMSVAEKSLHCSLNRISTIGDCYPVNSKLRLQKRSQAFVSLLNKFREGRRERVLLQHRPTLHKSVIKKLYSVMDDNSDVISISTPYFKKKIRGIACELFPGVCGIRSTQSESRHVAIQLGRAVAVFR